MAMKVVMFVHDADGDMGDATVIGPFSSWELAEAFRDRHYPYYNPGNLEAIIVPMAGVRDSANHPPYDSSP